MQTYYSLIDTIEKSLAPLGLMDGNTAIPKRFLFGGILGGVVVALVKPDSMFENGVARPWSFLSGPNAGNGPKPTSTPWLIGPAVGAIFFGLFV